MKEERKFITKEKALEMIGEKEKVHVFMNPTGMLIGADWSMTEIKSLIENAETLEIGGDMCQRMKHPIVATLLKKHHFIEASL